LNVIERLAGRPDAEDGSIQGGTTVDGFAMTMRELTAAEAAFVSGGFSWGELVGHMAIGAGAGALIGLAGAGLGAGPGALGGALIGGIEYSLGELVDYCF
jgi:hypothetical protein